MDTELSRIEEKIEQVVAYCQTLREENRVLCERVSGLEDEKQTLAAKIETARERLEALMARLPEA